MRAGSPWAFRLLARKILQKVFSPGWSPEKLSARKTVITSSELVSELAKIHRLFEWKLVPDTGSGSEQRSQPRLWIRCTGKDGPDGLIFEPIGAVCFVQTATPYGDDMWSEAATTLGLSETDARDLLDASNDSTWRTVDGRREPDPRMMGLRKQLADAVHLRISIFKVNDRVQVRERVSLQVGGNHGDFSLSKT